MTPNPVNRRHRIKAMNRTFRALSHCYRTGDEQRLARFILKLGRILNRQFGYEEAGEIQVMGGEKEPLTPLPDDLDGEVGYCSDRWCLRRYQRIKAYLMKFPERYGLDGISHRR